VLWLGNVDEQRATVHQIERVGGQPGAARVTDEDLDGRQPALGDELLRQRRVRGVGVDADHPPTGRDAIGEEVDDSAGTAAEVDGTPARTDSDPIEQLHTVG